MFIRLDEMQSTVTITFQCQSPSVFDSVFCCSINKYMYYKKYVTWITVSVSSNSSSRFFCFGVELSFQWKKLNIINIKHQTAFGFGHGIVAACW